MNLFEYQSKKLFSKFGLPVLKGNVCSSMLEVQNYISNIENNSAPWILKCQIHAGGRGKSGGIRTVYSKKDILSFAETWLGKRLITYQTNISGEIVNTILIEPSVKIIREFYFSISIDRDSSQIVCMISNQGGIDIEKVIYKTPNLIYKTIIDPIAESYPYQGRILASQLCLTGTQIDQFVKIYISTVHMFLEKDLMLVEINPLIITEQNSFLCLDAKVIIDCNALFRQPDLLNLLNTSNSKTNHLSSDSYDKQLECNYIDLDGNIGCMVNGAGLAMATMDLMKLLGGAPANFLDIGGDANTHEIISKLHMLLRNIKIKAIFVNIFGGIVCCDLVANSIITAVSQCTSHVPLVVRLEGNNSQLGSNKLIKSSLNIIVINNLINAIRQVIGLVK